MFLVSLFQPAITFFQSFAAASYDHDVAEYINQFLNAPWLSSVILSSIFSESPVGMNCGVLVFFASHSLLLI